jgi:hypothetical protein
MSVCIKYIVTFVKMWSLERIATKYGISRERVRQIIGNSGHLVQSRQRRIYEENKHLSNSRLSDAMGVVIGSLYHYRSGERHEIDEGGKGGGQKAGAEMEDLVSKKLHSIGIDNTLMPHQHPFDILLQNGKRVDVKSTDPAAISRNSPIYSFTTGTYRKGNYCDFLILVLRDVTEYFVVPIDDAKGIIRFCWPETSFGKKSKWLRYHNRFDLLKA